MGTINIAIQTLKKLAINSERARKIAQGRKSIFPILDKKIRDAQNPNTPLDIIQKLADDANRLVRAAAKDNLEKREKSNI